MSNQQTDIYNEQQRELAQEAETMQHTPGPWFVEQKDIGRCFRIFPEKGGDLVASIEQDILCPLTNSPRSEANARLIAAAPELLEACKEAYTMLGEYLIEVNQEEGAANELHNQIGEAIAKTRGE